MTSLGSLDWQRPMMYKNTLIQNEFQHQINIFRASIERQLTTFPMIWLIWTRYLQKPDRVWHHQGLIVARL